MHKSATQSGVFPWLQKMENAVYVKGALRSSGNLVCSNLKVIMTSHETLSPNVNQPTNGADHAQHALPSCWSFSSSGKNTTAIQLLNENENILISHNYFFFSLRLPSAQLLEGILHLKPRHTETQEKYHVA